jgi:hypothetical protein
VRTVRSKLRRNFAGLAVVTALTAGVVNAGSASAAVSTSTTVSASPTTAPATTSVTLHAIVKATTGSAIPSGSVVFSDGSTVLATKTLSHGAVSLITKAFGTGTHWITVKYKGTSSFGASTSPATSVVMTLADGTTRVTSSSNPAAAGTLLKFSVAVTPVAPATSTPTGKASLVIDGKAVTTSSLSSGKVTFSSIKLGIGPHGVTVSYSGDHNFATSTASLTQYVDVAATSITLTSSANPSAAGRAAYVAATISHVSGTPTPTGTVTFADGGHQVAAIPIGAGAVAFPLAGLSPGTHALVASYSGDASNAASTSPELVETISQPDADGPADLDTAVINEWVFIGAQLAASSATLPATSYPIQSVWQTGSWVTTSSASWTAGFYPGSLWLAAQATGDAAIETQASSRLSALAAQDRDQYPRHRLHVHA